MCKGLRQWNSQDHEAVKLDKHMQRMEIMKRSWLWIGIGGWSLLIIDDNIAVMYHEPLGKHYSEIWIDE